MYGVALVSKRISSGKYKPRCHATQLRHQVPRRTKTGLVVRFFSLQCRFAVEFNDLKTALPRYILNPLLYPPWTPPPSSPSARLEPTWAAAKFFPINTRTSEQNISNPAHSSFLMGPPIAAPADTSAIPRIVVRALLVARPFLLPLVPNAHVPMCTNAPLRIGLAHAPPPVPPRSYSDGSSHPVRSPLRSQTPLSSPAQLQPPPLVHSRAARTRYSSLQHSQFLSAAGPHPRLNPHAPRTLRLMSVGATCPRPAAPTLPPAPQNRGAQKGYRASRHPSRQQYWSHDVRTPLFVFTHPHGSLGTALLHLLLACLRGTRQPPLGTPPYPTCIGAAAAPGGAAPTQTSTSPSSAPVTHLRAPESTNPSLHTPTPRRPIASKPHIHAVAVASSRLVDRIDGSKSGYGVYGCSRNGVHWRRAHGGALKSLVAS
ncbi:hypothetical protein B0H10DRAFT_1949984 [Mycena sp. CBHHK59/15]|nr:hypothetical protein B0H10DRAFT_1949984 [Mycena sp. CBHHK59/15]